MNIIYIAIFGVLSHHHNFFGAFSEKYLHDWIVPSKITHQSLEKSSFQKLIQKLENGNVKNRQYLRVNKIEVAKMQGLFNRVKNKSPRLYLMYLPTQT